MIATADSVTELRDVRGRVLVAGSHGGIVAAGYAAAAGVRAAIFHDAGIAKDRSGVAGLAMLEAAGMAAAAVSHTSARIGDGIDCLARGTIGHANAIAAACGVTVGQPCRDAAVCLLAAPLIATSLPKAVQGRRVIAPGVLACDSIGLLEAQDAGSILVIGSHASLHGGRPESARPIEAPLAFFHEGGGDCSRLPVLEARGIAAVAVEGMSARIGDGASLWETGVVSNCNGPAARAGIRLGMTVQAAIRGFLQTQSR
jgi:hypothetical protein